MGVWAEAFFKNFRPRPRLTGSEWADQYRFVPAGTSPEAGQWRTDRTPYLREPMDVATDKTTETVVLQFASQVGKALALDTPLPTPTGWTTMGEVKPGDELFDEQGKACKVLAKTEIMHNHECYKIAFSDGSEIIADADHVWSVKSQLMPLGLLSTDQMHDLHVESMVQTDKPCLDISVAKALRCEEKELPIKPYTLGVWLGRGDVFSNQIHGRVDNLAIIENIKKDGYQVEIQAMDDRSFVAVIDPKEGSRGKCMHGHEQMETSAVIGRCATCAKLERQNRARLELGLRPTVVSEPIQYFPDFYKALLDLRLIGDKFVPMTYLRSSVSQRLELLRGIMDSVGYVDQFGYCGIVFKYRFIAYTVKELLSSLGFKPKIRKKVIENDKGGKRNFRYCLSFFSCGDQNIFKLPYKRRFLKARVSKKGYEELSHHIVNIEPVSSVPVQCIAVDSPSHLFLAGVSMVPTHNSEALLNILGFYADQEPSPQLMLQPTIEMAESFSKERIEPMFQQSRGLTGKLVEGKDGYGTSRKSANTIRLKQYPGGYLALVGANSPAGLASRPIRVLLCDEIDRYGTTKEGDPLKLAIQRTTNFNNRKIILVSTPTIEGASYINDWYERSDKRKFLVPCPHCGKRIELTWSLVTWGKDDEDQALPMTAAMFCPECGAKFRGADKLDPHTLEQGEWVATNPESSIKGYHLNALYSPWVSLHKLVEEFVNASHNKDNAGLMEFINLKLGEVWTERAVGADFWEKIRSRHEYYDSPAVLPSGVLVLTAGVDVQHDRVECTVFGWGKGKEAWGIAHHILEGAPDDPDTWAQLDAVLAGPYTMSGGAQISVACTCVDSGDGSYTADVYRYTGPREVSRIFSVKGVGGAGRPFVSTPTRNNSQKAVLFSLGVDAGKSRVMGALKVEDEGPGFVHFSRRSEDGFCEEYFKQLTAEVQEYKRERGRNIIRWKKIRDRNEALDCAVYAFAALEIINPSFEQLEAFYQGGVEAAQQVVQQVPQQAVVRKRRPNSKGVVL